MMGLEKNGEHGLDFGVKADSTGGSAFSNGV
jgi:hypothetical protein